MKRVMCSVAEVSERVRKGARLLLAGDERLLAQLPAGDWIGGTIPYFMAEQGGLQSAEKLFVTEMPGYVVKAEVGSYDERQISRIFADGPERGFTVVIIPAQSSVHLAFGMGAPSYPRFALHPVLGWISGVALSDLGKVSPKVFDGRTPRALTQEAVVMRVTLPPTKAAELSIHNIFEPSQGEVITFERDGFSAAEALVNGKRVNFAEHLRSTQADPQRPLVADYYGAMINVSFQSVEKDEVRFYAPVFRGVEYRHAKPVGDYVASFQAALPQGTSDRALFSCNCILNYLYGSLEGKRTAEVVGPITFGEVAYQLLNQTLVTLTVHDV